MKSVRRPSRIGRGEHRFSVKHSGAEGARDQWSIVCHMSENQLPA